MKQTISAPNTVPTANIAVNKSRLKVYKNAGNLPTYYLQKSQEFQIELSNPTTDVVLAKVILNGKAISQGGLVLNPGQRVYLERYLDVAKKFLFDTYEVSGSAEMQKAIADNGDIKVEFYREKQPYIDNTYRPHIMFNSTGLGNYNAGTPAQFLRSGSTGISNGASGISNGTYTTQGLNGCITNTIAGSGSLNCSNLTYTSGAPTLDGMNTLSLGDEIINPTRMKKSLLSGKLVETGRVEKGSDSDQEFRTVNKSFEYSAFHTIEYKMLPISQKVNTIEDINVKRYCTQCAHKLKPNFNFCPACGGKQ